MDRTPTKLSGEVQTLRKAKGLSLREFARQVDMSPSYASSWEVGRVTKDPSEKKIFEMERVLGLSHGQLLKISNTGFNKLSHKLFMKNVQDAEEVRLFFEKGSEKTLPSYVWKNFIYTMCTGSINKKKE